MIDRVKAAAGLRGNAAHRPDTEEERRGRFLEGTGSLVLDHQTRVAYACRSPRTDESLVREWARLMDYEPLLFDAATPDGTPVYHTNVVLWIGARIAGVGLEWVPEHSAPRCTRAGCWLGASMMLPLDDAQLLAFAGNMLELCSARGPARTW